MREIVGAMFGSDTAATTVEVVYSMLSSLAIGGFGSGIPSGFCQHADVHPVRLPLASLVEKRDPCPPQARVKAEKPTLGAPHRDPPRVGHLPHADERAPHCPDRCGIGTLRPGFALLAKSPSLATCLLVDSSVVPNSFRDFSMAVAS